MEFSDNRVFIDSSLNERSFARLSQAARPGGRAARARGERTAATERGIAQSEPSVSDGKTIHVCQQPTERDECRESEKKASEGEIF